MKKLFMSIGLSTIIALSTCVVGACKKHEEPPEPSKDEPPVETVTVYGEFYTLNEAYDDGDGFLPLETFQFICDNVETPENYSPLDETRKEKILHDYKQTHVLKSEQLEIDNYGSYGDCTVLRVRDKYYENEFGDIRYNDYYLGTYASPDLRMPSQFFTVQVWKECAKPTEVPKPKSPNGVFYSLSKAYENGYLTIEDIPKDLIRTSDNIPESLNWAETKEKIKQDFLSLDIELIGSVSDVEFLCERNGCLFVRIYTPINMCSFQVLVNTFHKINGVLILDTYPRCHIWVPFDN